MVHTVRSLAFLVAACLVVLPGCGQDDTAEVETNTEQAPPVANAPDFPEQAQDTTAADREAGPEDGAVAKTGPGEGADEDRPMDPPVAATPSRSGPPVEVKDATTDARADEGFAYVGASKCKGCHLKQYKSWATTTMATSFEGLRPGVKAEAKTSAGLDPDKDYTHEETCLRCHTTGYGKPGGFVSLETTPTMTNVQCEACHGPGIAYGQLMKEDKEYAIADAVAAGLVIPSAGPEGCLHCHGSGNPFNETVSPAYAFHFEHALEQSHDHLPLKREH